MAKKAASVEFKNVFKRYGGVTAVDDVSFSIAPGTLVTLLGPSGCGKTTTLRLIAGLEMASAGRIMIGDRDVTALSASERDVSMVFQSYALFPHMTVLENAAYGPTVSGETPARAKEMALAIAYSTVLIFVMAAAIVLIQALVGERRLGRRLVAAPVLQGVVR